MQEPTHILAGVLIQRSLRAVKPKLLAGVLTAVCAFLSHGLLDRLANATYHPASANFHDPVWVCFHLGVLVFTIWFLIIWWRRYWLGILFAALPDLDWVFIHGQKIFGLHLAFYQRPHLHDLLHVAFNEWPPFCYLRVPNHRLNPWASLWEVALDAAFLVVIYFLTRNDPQRIIRPGKTARIYESR